MVVTVEFDSYLDYATKTNIGYQLCELPSDVQDMLDELFDDIVIDNHNHPDNIYVNRLHIVGMTELKDYSAIKYNLNLPTDEAELEMYVYDHADEIEDVISEGYTFLGRDGTTFYFLQ